MHEGKPALVREQIAALRAAENVKAFGAFGRGPNVRADVSIYLCTYAPLVNCRAPNSGRAFTSTYAFRASGAPFVAFRRVLPVRRPGKTTTGRSVTVPQTGTRETGVKNQRTVGSPVLVEEKKRSLKEKNINYRTNDRKPPIPTNVSRRTNDENHPSQRTTGAHPARPGTGAAGKIGGRGGAAEQTAPRSQLDIYYISIRAGNLDLLRGFMIEHLFVFERMFW